MHCQEMLFELTVSHTETFSQCSLGVVNRTDGTRTCSEYETVSRETAPLVPIFTYNYQVSIDASVRGHRTHLFCLYLLLMQCTSILLEAYVPVLIIGFSLQLLLPFIFHYVVNGRRYARFPQFIRTVLNGIYWPDYFYNNVENFERVKAQDLMKMPNIICRDIVNPIAIIMTFGLCSPPLAFLAATVAAVKCHGWIWALNRFDAYTIDNENDNISGMTDDSKAQHYSKILSDMQLPIRGVLSRTFWIILVYSFLFIIFLYWDTRSGASWEAPLGMTLFFVLLLFLTFSKWNPRDSSQLEEATLEVKNGLMTVSMNPLTSSAEASSQVF